MSARSSKTAGLASWTSSTTISCRRARSAARKSGESWNTCRAAVMMPAGSKASGIRRSRTSRYSAYRAAAAVQSGLPHCRPRSARSPAVRPDSMTRSKSWRTSWRNPRVSSAPARSSGQGNSSPGRRWPSRSSLMMRSCSGPERSRGGLARAEHPRLLPGGSRRRRRTPRSGAGVVLRLLSSRAVNRSRKESAASLLGARISIRSGSTPSRKTRVTAASMRTVVLPVPGAPGSRTGPDPCATSTAAC
jgi:hypothetical protein